MLILASGKAYQLQVIHRKVEVASDPEHDKTIKMTCVPSESSDQPGQLPNLISHEETLGP